MTSPATIINFHQSSSTRVLAPPVPNSWLASCKAKSAQGRLSERKAAPPPYDPNSPTPTIVTGSLLDYGGLPPRAGACPPDQKIGVFKGKNAHPPNPIAGPRASRKTDRSRPPPMMVSHSPVVYAPPLFFSPFSGKISSSDMQEMTEPTHLHQRFFVCLSSSNPFSLAPLLPPAS